MIAAPLPNNESQRLQSLHALKQLDSPPEPQFDRLTRIAARCFNVPIALLSLVDLDRQWFKSRVGLEERQTPRSLSFCAHAILQDEPLIIRDTHSDPRFSDNPLVTGAPHVRFYAGRPVHGPDGYRIGTFCLLDRRPREFDAVDLQLLNDLAILAEQALNNKTLVQALTAEREATRLRRVLVSAITHDLRTPLTAIHGALGLVAGGAAGQLTEQALQLVEIAEQNSERLLRMINNLLDIERLESGTLPFEPQPVRLNELLGSALTGLQSYAAPRSVRLAPAPLQAEVTVMAEPDRLRQVLDNLLGNAIKFSPPGSTVTLGSTVLPDSRVRIAIKDQGPGISPAFALRIFNRFSQDVMASGEVGSSGLGLSIAKAIVERHDGIIGFDNNPEGGATFFIELPIVQTADDDKPETHDKATHQPG